MPVKSRDGLDAAVAATDLLMKTNQEAFAHLTARFSVDVLNKLTRTNGAKLSEMPDDLVPKSAVIKILQDFGMPMSAMPRIFVEALKTYQPRDIARCMYCERRANCTKGLPPDGFCSEGTYDMKSLDVFAKEGK